MLNLCIFGQDIPMSMNFLSLKDSESKTTQIKLKHVF